MIRKRYTHNQKAAIVLELLKEEETFPQIASRHGIHPNLLRKWKAQALEGLPNLFADDEQDKRALAAEHQRQLDELALKRRIDELYTAYPFYGSRKIAVVLGLNRKLVQRQMREMGIAGIVPGPNTSKQAAEHRVFPYLLRHITASYPNHIFGIDITYIRLLNGWMYLVALLDWYSRYVLAWQFSDTLELPFVLTCAQRALGQATPPNQNNHHHNHFTTPQYTQLLLDAVVQIRMDGR